MEFCIGITLLVSLKSLYRSHVLWAGLPDMLTGAHMTEGTVCSAMGCAPNPQSAPPKHFSGCPQATWTGSTMYSEPRPSFPHNKRHRKGQCLNLQSKKTALGMDP